MADNQKSISSTVARSSDGTIQVTFTIGWEIVSKSQKKALEKLSKNVQVAGFRKGKAPLEKVREKLAKERLIEETLKELLPKILGEIMTTHKIRPAIYPKLELISIKDNEPWQIRATTCDYPEINLGDYKKAVSAALRVSSLWTPDKSQKGKEGKPLSREEKEELVIKTLLETINPEIPRILIEEEVTRRLSQLLERIEKLGLTLESYLASIGKTADTLRKDYETQAKNSIKLELILNEIADKEGIKISESEIDKAIGITTGATNEPSSKFNTPHSRQMVRSVLRKRAVIDSLITLG